MTNSIINNFLNLVRSIIERPAMYGVNKVEDIHFIIMGYKFALNDKSEIEKLNNFLTLFREFVNSDFESSIDSEWVRLIRFHAGSDRHSIELFNGLLDKYLVSTNSN